MSKKPIQRRFWRSRSPVTFGDATMESQRVFSQGAADNSNRRNNNNKESGENNPSRDLADAESKPHREIIKAAEPRRIETCGHSGNRQASPNRCTDFPR